MPTYRKKPSLLEAEEWAEAEQILISMAEDIAYNTQPSYSANTELYPDNLIPFVDKHMLYIRTHPATDPRHYISNLRMMTRIRMRVISKPGILEKTETNS